MRWMMVKWMKWHHSIHDLIEITKKHEIINESLFSRESEWILRSFEWFDYSSIQSHIWIIVPSESTSVSFSSELNENISNYEKRSFSTKTQNNSIEENCVTILSVKTAFDWKISFRDQTNDSWCHFNLFRFISRRKWLEWTPIERFHELRD